MGQLAHRDAATIRIVVATTRTRVELVVDSSQLSPRPDVAVRRITLHPEGLAPLDSLVAVPANPTGVVVYFPGFNTPLGSWESVKCAHLADLSGQVVVVTEIPGMSRFGSPLPKEIRTHLLSGRAEPWAKLNLAYLAQALEAGEVDPPKTLRVLGFSTGCSLAVAALPALAEWGPITSLDLVEPVAITDRSLAALQAHNLADLGRMNTALATNRSHDWVVRARRSQSREPKVRYSPVDLIAIAKLLSSRSLLADLNRFAPARCALARGARSSLCRSADFDRLDQALADRGIPGPTITVSGLGHQMWHSFPAIVQISPVLLTA